MIEVREVAERQGQARVGWLETCRDPFRCQEPLFRFFIMGVLEGEGGRVHVLLPVPLLAGGQRAEEPENGDGPQRAFER